MKNGKQASSPRHWLTPKYWPTWLGIGIMWLVVKLPFGWQQAVGRRLGGLFRVFSQYRRIVVATNIKLCFPELDTHQQEKLARQAFASLGMSLIETAYTYWASSRDFDAFGRLEGLEHIEAARKQGKGVLLISGHFCSLDFAGRVLLRHHPICFTYQKLRNPLIDSALKTERARVCERLISRYDTRAFIRALKAGKVVWYAPDQDQARKNSVFAPFFGIPANTLTATTKLVKLTGAAVLPFQIQRLPDSKGYALKIGAALENFPGDSELEDATRFNAILESQVRENPEQYLWMHRRFKTRPKGEEKFYPRKPRRVRKQKRRQKQKQKERAE